MTERPPHGWDEIPEGHEVIAVPDKDWRLDSTGRCRAGAGAAKGPQKGKPGQRSCGRPSVAAMRRSTYRRTNPGHRYYVWWHYCEQHMYGRWVEDGQVMVWILVGIPGETTPVGLRSGLRSDP